MGGLHAAQHHDETTLVATDQTRRTEFGFALKRRKSPSELAHLPVAMNVIMGTKAKKQKLPAWKQRELGAKARHKAREARKKQQTKAMMASVMRNIRNVASDSDETTLVTTDQTRRTEFGFALKRRKSPSELAHLPVAMNVIMGTKAKKQKLP